MEIRSKKSNLEKATAILVEYERWCIDQETLRRRLEFGGQSSKVYEHDKNYPVERSAKREEALKAILKLGDS